ncbi:MAG: VanZ family protein [Gilvibacter sp.]
MRLVNSWTMRHIKNLLGPKTLFSFSLLYTLLITIVALSERSGLPEILWWEYQDKLAHLFAYVVLGCAWGLTWLYFRKIDFWKPYFVVLVSSSLVYGTIVEVLQLTTTTSRTADFWDVVANTIGVILGVVIAWYGYHKWLTIKN